MSLLVIGANHRLKEREPSHYLDLGVSIRVSVSGSCRVEVGVFE